MNLRRMLTAVLLTAGGLITAVPEMAAAEEKLEVKASTTMRDILSERVGKRVIVKLSSGENLEGTVTMVGNTLVHISRLAGKDFFDAVVSIDQVTGVLVQVRGR